MATRHNYNVATEGRTRYPWQDLEVGDYFEIGYDNLKGYNHVRQLVFAANHARKNVGKKFWHQKGEVDPITMEPTVIIMRVL